MENRQHFIHFMVFCEPNGDNDFNAVVQPTHAARIPLGGFVLWCGLATDETSANDAAKGVLVEHIDLIRSRRQSEECQTLRRRWELASQGIVE